MQESFLKNLAIKIGFAILVIALLDLVFLNWWLLKPEEKPADSNISIVTPSPLATPEVSPTPIVEPSPTPPVTQASPNNQPTVVTNTQTIVQTANKEIFIPLGSGSTKSNSFADIAGTDISIDLTKYSGVQSIIFQASLWVEGGNGRAYARLYNVDDKNPYIESQISSNSSSGSVEYSQNIPMPYSTKVYRVQAKTDITQFAAHVDNARIKITLK